MGRSGSSQFARRFIFYGQLLSVYCSVRSIKISKSSRPNWPAIIYFRVFVDVELIRLREKTLRHWPKTTEMHFLCGTGIKRTTNLAVITRISSLPVKDGKFYFLFFYWYFIFLIVQQHRKISHYDLCGQRRPWLACAIASLQNQQLLSCSIQRRTWKVLIGLCKWTGWSTGLFCSSKAKSTFCISHIALFSFFLFMAMAMKHSTGE